MKSTLLWSLVLSLVEPGLSGRMAQVEMGTVPCGCDNKVGVLAPKSALDGVPLPADPFCQRPYVHASRTNGRYCKCDKGKALNWQLAQGAAQKRLEELFQPKLQALKDMLSKMEETLGVEIDASSLDKVKPKVVSFPRKNGEGLWVCCCQSQQNGKCKKNAQMESSWYKSGIHHEAPARACEAETEVETEAVPSEEPEQEEEPQSAGGSEEPDLQTLEQESTGEEGTGESQESEELTEPKEPKEPEEHQSGRSKLLESIRQGTMLKATEPQEPPEPQEPSEPEEPQEPTPKKPARRAAPANLLAGIRAQAGKPLKKTTKTTKKSSSPLSAALKAVQLKPAKERQLKPKPDTRTKRDKLLGEIKAGVQLSPPKERTSEVKEERPENLMDVLTGSEKFKKLRETMQKEPEEEDDEDWE